MPDFFTGPTCESENLELVREMIPELCEDGDRTIQKNNPRDWPDSTRRLETFSLEITLGPYVSFTSAVATAQILPRARRRLTLEEGVTLSRCLGM
jgi:hypothetical protein